jgi:alkylresorcinol/alkylpyrone synthase
VPPAHRYAQFELADLFAEAVGATSGSRYALVKRLHTNSGVAHRNLALPEEAYAALFDLGVANGAFITGAVDLVVAATVTGIAVPTLDGRPAWRACTGHPPGDVAVLICVELCSLTFQRDDLSTANLAVEDLTRADLTWWVAHPGSPKVLEALQEAPEVRARRWRSSASVVSACPRSGSSPTVHPDAVTTVMTMTLNLRVCSRSAAPSGRPMPCPQQ